MSSCHTLQKAEIIRKLQKASFQTLYLSTESFGQQSNYFGRFTGPPDTEAKFDGDELISFQNSRSPFFLEQYFYMLVHERFFLIIVKKLLFFPVKNNYIILNYHNFFKKLFFIYLNTV